MCVKLWVQSSTLSQSDIRKRLWFCCIFAVICLTDKSCKRGWGGVLLMIFRREQAQGLVISFGGWGKEWVLGTPVCLGWVTGRKGDVKEEQLISIWRAWQAWLILSWGTLAKVSGGWSCRESVSITRSIKKLEARTSWAIEESVNGRENHKGYWDAKVLTLGWKERSSTNETDRWTKGLYRYLKCLCV